MKQENTTEEDPLSIKNDGTLNTENGDEEIVVKEEIWYNIKYKNRNIQ